MKSIQSKYKMPLTSQEIVLLISSMSNMHDIEERLEHYTVNNLYEHITDIDVKNVMVSITSDNARLRILEVIMPKFTSTDGMALVDLLKIISSDNYRMNALKLLVGKYKSISSPVIDLFSAGYRKVEALELTVDKMDIPDPMAFLAKFGYDADLTDILKENGRISTEEYQKLKGTVVPKKSKIGDGNVIKLGNISTSIMDSFSSNPDDQMRMLKQLMGSGGTVTFQSSILSNMSIGDGNHIEIGRK